MFQLSVKSIFILVSFLSISVYAADQNVVLEKVLDNNVDLGNSGAFSYYNDPAFNYFYRPEKGFLRRELNKIQFFDLNFEKKWEHNLTLMVGSGNYPENIFRFAFNDDFVFIAYYSKTLENQDENIELVKINLTTGEKISAPFRPSDPMKKIENMVYQNDKLYIFGSSCYKCDIFYIHKYYSNVVAVNQNLEIDSKLDLPILQKEGTATVNWMFIDANERQFRYQSFYYYAGTSLLSGKREETIIYDYNFKLVSHNISEKERPLYYQNSIKYDTTEFKIFGNHEVNYYNEGPILDVHGGPSYVDGYFNNAYLQIEHLAVQRNGSPKTEILFDIEKLLVITPKSHWLFIDAISDPSNNSISLLIRSAIWKPSIYCITLNEELKVASIHLIKYKMESSNAPDYNFCVVGSKPVKVWKSVANTSKQNAFDLIYEQGEGKVCSIVNSNVAQFVFFDDLVTKTTKVFKLQ